MLRACLVLFVLLPLLVQATDLKPQESRIFFPELESRIASELGFSLRELSKSEQAPATLFGEPLGGSFTWSSFAFTLSRFQLLSGEDMLGGQPTAPWIQRGLASEVEGGGKTFSQLFAAAILLNSCKVPGELSSSPLWTSLSPERRLVYKNFLDVRRFVDDQGSPTGGLPNNYAAVALLLEAYRSRLGLTDDPRVLFKLFEFCLSLLARTDGFLDDHRRFQGSFDRYHHEFIRFVWISAELTGRADILQTLRPWLRRSARRTSLVEGATTVTPLRVY